MTSVATGLVHSLPLCTSRSHATRLCATGSKVSSTAAQPISRCQCPALRLGVALRCSARLAAVEQQVDDPRPGVGAGEGVRGGGAAEAVHLAGEGVAHL